MKKVLLGVFTLFLGILVMAQNQTISGTVTDAETGEGIPGATVVVKGSTTGTVSDFDGNYQLTVGSDAVLQVSFVGYLTQEITIGGRSVVNVELAVNIAQLAEVVVIGYGQIEKKDATGSVASVKADDFNGGVIASPEQLFQGKAAGVQITGNSGEPGAGISIRIRGASSVRNGNDPLFVVDGIPLTSASTSSGGADLGRGTSSSSNPLNFLNPNDIASIDILKDASATAIYGSRGANGVVIITTKSGKGTKATLSYNSSVSFSAAANEYELLNRQQFLDGAVARGSQLAEIDFDENTDWQEEVFQTGVSFNQDLAYGNSYGSGDYRVSLSYGKQDGLFEKSELKRFTGRANVNHRLLDDKLKLGFQGTFSNTLNSQLPFSNTAGFEGDFLAAVYMANPTWPADPKIQNSSTNLNPLSYIEYSQDETSSNRALIGLSAEYEIMEGLTGKVNVAVDRSNSLRESALSSDLNTSARSIFGNGMAARAEWWTASDLIEVYFNYNKDIGNSKLGAVAGYSAQEFRREGKDNQAWGFNTTNLDRMISNMDDAIGELRYYANDLSGSYQQFGYDSDGLFVNRLSPNQVIDEYNGFNSVNTVKSATENIFEEVDAIQSYFVRVNYTINDKYLLTGTVRADGSSKFGEDNQYGIFPSLAGAWRVSDESFAPSFFQDLKVRAGWGITGNQEIPHNLHQARQRYGGISVGDGGNVNNPGISTVTFGNPDLQWEETEQINFGIDWAIYEGRINGTIDFYNKTTTNLLIKVTSAQPAPQPFFWTNLDAEVVNKGIELTLNANLMTKDDLTWDVSANYSFNENEITGLTGGLNTGQINGQGLSGAFAQRIENDQPLYSFYLREFQGFDDDGNSVYKGGDVQKFINKQPVPKSNVGLSTSAKYKDFMLSVYAYGQFGHYLYNNTANALFTAGSLGNGRNVIKDVLSNGEEPSNSPDVSTRFLEKGDFIRIQNIALSYNINTSNIDFVDKLTVNATVQNVFLITDYSGNDPEVNTDKALDDIPSFGIEYTPYPRPRIFTLGLSATF